MSAVMRDFQPFAYMQWAKAQAGGRYHLGMSGLTPPDPGPPLEVDMAQRGPDMPPAARAAVAARYGVADEQVMLTLGTSHALYVACASQLSPGDACLVESPDYEVLHLLPPLFGARAERFERRMAAGYRIDGEVCARVRELAPRVTLVTNPHNPSGACLSLAELAPLAEAVAAVRGTLIVDEVYLEYLADAPAHSALRLGDHVLVMGSLTKAFGYGAVRCGWLVGAADAVTRAIRYNDFISVLYPTPLAQIGMAALARLPELQARARDVHARGVAILAEWVGSRRDVTWHRPEAGVMALLRLERVTDARAFCERLAREREVIVVPGDFFGAPGCVRIGYGCDEAILREGLRRLGEALDAS
jgi:aspartate/methionine/tyrosine aminotransferase